MISIIIPVYNVEEYLAACLDSLLVQTVNEPLQIILVDDESTDNSLSIARSYAKKDPRFEVYTQAHAGQSAARNLGLQHVKGEFVAFLDADDRLAPDWCLRHRKAIGDADYVQSGYRRSSEKTTRKKERWWHVGKRRLPRTRYRYTSPCMRLYRKETLEGMRFEEGMIYEDVLFSVDLWCRHPECQMLKYTGYLYTKNPHSTTAKRHPADQKKVLLALHQRRKGQSLRNKIIITETMIRLSFHFMAK